jgi:16S rRNA G966 N2-methylase RsmD
MEIISLPKNIGYSSLARFRMELYQKYKSKLHINLDLNRKLVSFQENKKIPIYSWFKYKEGFTARLVNYIFDKLKIENGTLLDPFAGAGAALFAARLRGINSVGIEVLPVGVFSIEAKNRILNNKSTTFIKEIRKILNNDFLKFYTPQLKFKNIPITNGAFPIENERKLLGYLNYCKKIKDNDLKMALLFLGFCVLENISYTRKDGQYLRWDFRSDRKRSENLFNKGTIYSFDDAIKEKLNQIIFDLTSDEEQFDFLKMDKNVQKVKMNIIAGSCLEILPTLKANSVDIVVTSPPYCNRYDYTRTYALELMYLGFTDEQIKKFRQTMLSCTVENKDKVNFLKDLYFKNKNNAGFEKVNSVFDHQKALHEVLNILDKLAFNGKLNNSNISRMVRNYFYEMCFVVFEISRLIRKNGYFVMINDNVQYSGHEVPVDLILSDFASAFDFDVEKIWVLPVGKGNSSQQMGIHGRNELRKCIYIWRKK